MIEYIGKYNEILRNICEENPTSYANVLRSIKYSNLLEYVNSCTSGFMDKNERLAKKLNFVLREFQDFPKCNAPGCENAVLGSKTMTWNSEWPKHCCNRCAQKDPETIKAAKKTKFENHGNENYNGNTEELKKRNLEKYGSEWFFSSKVGKERIRETWRRNGYEHPMKNKALRDEMIRRYMERHGVPYSCVDPKAMRKSRLPYLYENTYFKSSWELAFFIFLEDSGKKFEYQPEKSFAYFDGNGKEHRYFPDFLVDGEFVEIKGDQFVGNGGEYVNPYDFTHETDGTYEAKRKCMVENGVKVLSKEEMKPILRHCSEKFGSSVWHLKFKSKFKSEKYQLSLEIPPDYPNMTREFEYFSRKFPKELPRGVGSRNLIVKYFQQDVFFKRERELWENDDELRKRLVENRKRYLNKDEEDLTPWEILSGFKHSGLHYGYSHFNPLWFRWFLERYGVERCYDPCGGWGHRLLGALGIERYIYNDLSKNTKENVDRMIDFFGVKNTVTYNMDCRRFVPVEDFDAMFTCPPYFNVERYECGGFSDRREYDEFLDTIFETFRRKEGCRILGLVIREDLLGERHSDWTERFEITPERKGHLSKSKNNFREYLFVFRK